MCPGLSLGLVLVNTGMCPHLTLGLPVVHWSNNRIRLQGRTDAPKRIFFMKGTGLCSLFFSFLFVLPYLFVFCTAERRPVILMSPPPALFLMSPPCLESQGCQFQLILLFYVSSLVLLPSPVALSVFSFSAFGPFSWPLFPPKTLIFWKVGSFVWLLWVFFGVIRRLVL